MQFHAISNLYWRNKQLNQTTDEWTQERHQTQKKQTGSQTF